MQKKIKFLPKGIQSFEKMILHGYVYVDKTRQIYDIITQGSYYFLARPRRFGKSLLLSTLKELFSGSKKLFDGLWIATSNYSWKEYPVIHISFSALANNTPEALERDLTWKLLEIAKQYSVDIQTAPSLQTKFSLLVEKLAQINSVVILIDEYDFPILNNIQSEELASACRDVLRNFFGVIKDLDHYLHFVMITGVSKFSKTSIFSGLNNLEDLTMSQLGATVLGYTYQEIEDNFEYYIKNVAQQTKTTPASVLDGITRWYNGYKFTEDSPAKLYNPYSVLLFLASGKFKNYWFETGTPTFLLNLIKSKQYAITNFDDIEVSSDELGTIEIDDISVTPLLFQTGYLTIHSYDPETENYHLTFPNIEVKSSLLKHILKKFSKMALGSINEFALGLTKALKSQNIDLFCRLLQTFFAEIPSGIQIPQLEKYYQTILYVLGKIIGLSIDAEVMTNIGRIDMVMQTDTKVYIFEFKMNKPAKQALDQILEKSYHQKYQNFSKKILLVGVSFSTNKRNVEDWVVQEIE